MKKYLRRKKSLIHGHGLFTSVDIERDTVIGLCQVKPTQQRNHYTLSAPSGDFDVTCKLKYINHSSNPNVIYYGCDFSVVALKDIPAGAELTHDYGEDWVEGG